MIRASRIFLSRIFFSGCAVLLAAAALPATAQPKPRDISIGLQAAITSMDPHFHNLSPNNSMMLHFFEPLIKRDENQKQACGHVLSRRDAAGRASLPGL